MGSKDGTPFDLKIGFKGIDFYKLLSNSNYQEFEIDGEYITSVRSSFKDIEIPLTFTEDYKFTIIPLPSKEFTTDIFIPFSSYYINNVKISAYGNLDIIRLEHASFRLEFNLREDKFNFKTKDFNSLIEAKNIFNFLNTLLNETNKLSFNIPNGKEPAQFSFDVNKAENKDDDNLLNQLSFITKLVNELVEVQNYYKVNFNEFYFNLSPQEYDNLQILLLNINGERQSIKSVKLNIDVYDHNTFKEILNEKGTPMSIVHKSLNVPLFNQCITISDKQFTIEAPDAYFLNKGKIKKQITKSKTHSNIEIKIRSHENRLVRYFSNNS